MDTDASARASWAGKVMPPPAPRWLLDRPRVDERLDRSARARLVLVTGSAGSGKTVALASWASNRRAAWYGLDAADRSLATLARGVLDALRLRVPALPDTLLSAMVGELGPDAGIDERARAEAGAGALAAALREVLMQDLVLVLDDLDELGAGTASCAFVAALCRQGPATLHLALASRDLPAFPIERLRGRGEVAEVVASDLAFTSEEVAAILAEGLDPAAGSLAEAVRAMTGGWPAAVMLTVQALQGVPPAGRARAVEHLSGRTGPLHRYLVAEVFEQERPEAQALLRAVAPLPAFDAPLCEDMGHADAEALLASLRSRGVFVEHAGPAGWLRLTGLARDVIGARIAPESRASVLRTALAALESRGHAEPALLLCAEAGDHAAAARILERSGAALVSAGAAELVTRVCDALPESFRSTTVEQVHGEALQVQGAWAAALACFARVAQAGRGLPPGLAWRMGVIHYLRGELDAALDVFAQAALDGDEPADEALLLAWWAAALWRQGEAAGCRARAEAAFAAAQRSGDDRALAAAHTALAMLAALEGDRRGNDAHYLQALDAAQRAGDVLQIIRIRTNRASHFLDEGFYHEALAEAEIAVGIADPAGYATFHSLALNNHGEAAMHLGRLEEAIADFRSAQAIEQRIGSRTVGYPLLGLGDVYRLRGDLTQARAAYREAVELAEEVDDVQLVVPALAGLARTLLGDDPAAARAAAERAVARGPGMGHAQALLAAGWAALADGDPARAETLLQEVDAVAPPRRDRPAMAEALELRAALHPGDAPNVLSEAVSLWRDIGNPVRRAQAERQLARAVGGVEGHAAAEAAVARLGRLGVRTLADAAGEAEVEVRCLGGFRLAIKGSTLPMTAWQSRKARDLLKILVARRGRATAREVLIDLLWPGEDPDRIGNRLSVALSTVRGILDPDRRQPPEWFVRADKSTVALDLDHLWVDLEHFLAGAERGLRLREEGRADEGRALLAAVERLYGGDFLEEDVYEEWAVAPREQARAAYVAAARALAEDAGVRGDYDPAVRLYLRVLERDPYDEPAHLRLVETLTAAGRHGEARRHYRTYAGRMAELSVEASPFPG